jgi:MFS family permease
MLNKFFRRFIRRRHYWRDINFDELTELYTSMMFRSLAIGLVGIFIPLYLYQNGSPVWQILFFYMVTFVVQMLFSPLSAFVIARIGPKHTILLSYIFQSLTMVGLILLYDKELPIYLISLTLGITNVLFFPAFHVDFSKIKHSIHGGKEVGWMYIMQKIGLTLGPIVGGVIAYIFGSQYIFMAALGLLFLGVLPLLFTAEPVKIKQKLDFNQLKVNDIKSDITAYSGLVLENSISIVVWPLFVGVIVFKDNQYLQLGSIASLSIVASLLIARAIGTLIDEKKGRSLLRYGAGLNAVLHLFRAFVSSFSAVLAVNIVNDGVTIAYTMPFTKGMYDAADQLPGHRIVYFCTLEAIGSFIRLIFYGTASLVAFYVGDSKFFFFGLFVVGSIASLTIMREKFVALKP